MQQKLQFPQNNEWWLYEVNISPINTCLTAWHTRAVCSNRFITGPWYKYLVQWGNDCNWVCILYKTGMWCQCQSHCGKFTDTTHPERWSIAILNTAPMMQNGWMHKFHCMHGTSMVPQPDNWVRCPRFWWLYRTQKDTHQEPVHQSTTTSVSWVFNWPTFPDLIHARIGRQRERLGVAAAGFLQARCPSCHPNNSTKALNKIASVRIITVVISALSCVYTKGLTVSELYAWQIGPNNCHHY